MGGSQVLIYKPLRVVFSLKRWHIKSYQSINSTVDISHGNSKYFLATFDSAGYACFAENENPKRLYLADLVGRNTFIYTKLFMYMGGACNKRLHCHSCL